jgi:hypothetical protein
VFAASVRAIAHWQSELVTILVPAPTVGFQEPYFLVAEKDAKKNDPSELTGRRMCCHPTRFCHPHDKK